MERSHKHVVGEELLKAALHPIGHITTTMKKINLNYTPSYCLPPYSHYLPPYNTTGRPLHRDACEISLKLSWQESLKCSSEVSDVFYSCA